MPTFTGNLKTVGIEPRPGRYPKITARLVRAGVDVDGNAYAGSSVAEIESNGDVTLTLATTIGLTPFTQVKLVGEWLGDDSHFELGPFSIPEESGTLADLMALADLGPTTTWGSGMGPWPDWFSGYMWVNLATDPATAQVREF
ncbi:hypothetical protein SCB71_14365 [Herbiconiux sp. KACC 21604]|uniref:hypothetical protein n=1 Tax=unclassified Herbiconiux TaxID=2618217 RepID=UPI0014924DDC|nr:hypothetical protein [Herbiconiux sp. SALV-R1]QJU54326.1 hypothetical protein HL652_12305 [Herbiconiux sp. SALV-R1]WPO85396.1 hypothetical protein SCB71_14365 [Herbiconiux sp. KACC 21604]